MLFLGDLREDQTIEFLFSTNDLGSAPATLSGSPSLAVYKTGSTTQSTAGLTLTVDYDSVTGLNHVQVDTLADAFYEAGNDYSIVLAAGTVDGVSVVGKVIGTFSIENRNIKANVTQWNGSAVAMPATAGYPAVTLKVGTGTGELDLSSGTVKLAATTHTGATIPTVTDVTNLHASAATAANQTTILARLGAWTGSSANTILGAFRALFRSDSDAAVPSDINADLGSGAGTAANTTDSVQAIAAELDGLSRFDPSTDKVTVQAIDADAIDDTALADAAAEKIALAVSEAVGGTHTVCRLAAAMTSSAGTEVRLMAWLEQNGQFVDLASLDAEATCTITVREHGAELDLFEVDDDGDGPNASGRFELSVESPNFTDDRLYSAIVVITENGNTWTTQHAEVVFG